MAGLHAAFKLGEIGIRDVVILEALDRIGGRIHTIPVNGDVVELGAQWIHGQGENPLWKFVQENQVRHLITQQIFLKKIATTRFDIRTVLLLITCFK